MAMNCCGTGKNRPEYEQIQAHEQIQYEQEMRLQGQLLSQREGAAGFFPSTSSRTKVLTAAICFTLIFVAIVGAILCFVADDRGLSFKRFRSASLAETSLKGKVSTMAEYYGNPNLPGGSCVPDEKQDWNPLSNFDPAVLNGLQKVILILEDQRAKECDRAPSLRGSNCFDWIFSRNSPGSNLDFKAQFKYRENCNGTIFSFDMQCENQPVWFAIDYEEATHKWESLGVNPGICALNSEVSGGPAVVPATDLQLPRIQELGALATQHLQELRELEGCAGPGSLSLKEIKKAYTQVTRDQETALDLVIQFPDGLPVNLCVTAISTNCWEDPANCNQKGAITFSTGFFGDHRFLACDPNLVSRSCEHVNVSSDEISRGAFGLVEQHPAELALKRRLAEENYFFRGLKEDYEMAPSQERFIPPVAARELQAPLQFSPHLEGQFAHCFRGAAMLNQGFCGCCYASATVTMMSIRRCMYLTEKEGGEPNPLAYNYAQQEFLSCACNDEQCKSRSGCLGGRMEGIWGDWMRKYNGNLRRRDCFAFQMKCFASPGVVNKHEGHLNCQGSEGEPMWSRPCKCISADLKPQLLPTCPAYSQNYKECADLERPTKMYIVSGMLHGLSMENTVRNIKLHLIEGGPIYFACNVLKTFNPFFYGAGARGDVFDGGGSSESEGRHAMVITGYGQTTQMEPKGLQGFGHDYWTVRNSYDHDWGQRGYGNILAGKDVMNIESGRMGSMAAAFWGDEGVDYKDHTYPHCKWARADPNPTMRMGYIARYALQLNVLCSSKASFQVSWNMAGQKGNPTEGTTEAFSTPAFSCGPKSEGQECIVSGIDLLAAGYGLIGSSNTVRLAIRAWDADLNAGWSFTSYDLHPIEQDPLPYGPFLFGVPGAKCSGCRDEDPFEDSQKPTQFAFEQTLGEIPDTEARSGLSATGIPWEVKEPTPASFLGSPVLGKLLNGNLKIYVAVVLMVLLAPFFVCTVCGDGGGRHLQRR
ncbi:unnamed protein product [Polarella glacialis]|uniref:Peptidase C1A papain C-terminal domain-containing protein n=1 Tax=Polarella glacialis TaxID=89957 RepID=A0A813FB62_POLGL|nr:unnamed protein product [Polarella glacialis]CAE8727564.1 unnamed protein product [Polarella glacialis]